MTEQTNQETVSEETTVNESTEESQEQAQEQPKYKQLVFNTQPEAYQFLQHECPKEYSFAAGMDRDTGKRVVVVVLPA